MNEQKVFRTKKGAVEYVNTWESAGLALTIKEESQTLLLWR